eukprot:753260-Hanusia_phi.AAC.2
MSVYYHDDEIHQHASEDRNPRLKGHEQVSSNPLLSSPLLSSPLISPPLLPAAPFSAPVDDAHDPLLQVSRQLNRHALYTEEGGYVGGLVTSWQTRLALLLRRGT